MIKNSHDIFIEGRHVNLREVEVEDAAFILSLRLSEKGRKFLHKTENDVEKQKEYIKRYKGLDYEWYFIVEDKQNNKIGCISVYDVRGNSVCTGRWVMLEGCGMKSGIEGNLLLKEFAFSTLGANEIRMDTKHSNKNMQNYFKQWGCVIDYTTEELIFVTLSKEDFLKNKTKIERFCQ